MPFKSKAHARAAFKKFAESAEVTSGVKAPKPEVDSGIKSPSPQVTSGLDKAKSTGAAKVETKKPDVGEAKSKPEATSGVKAPAPEVKTGLDRNKKPEVTSLTKEGAEVTSGVKAPKPEVEEGVKAPAPQVTSGLKEAEVTSGVKAPKPEVDEGVKAPTPQVTSGLKEAEVTSGVKAPKPEVEEGVKAPTPQVTSGLKEEDKSKDKGEAQTKPDSKTGLKSPEQGSGTKGKPGSEDKQATPTPPTSSPVVAAGATEGFEGKMDEGSEAKYKTLEEKKKTLAAEIEALEKELAAVKELGVKKFTHNTKKEEVAKLGDEIKALKEKSRDPMKLPVPDRKGNEHMPKPTQNIPSKKWKASKNRKGWKKDIKKDLDEKAKVLSEGFTNAYVAKASKKNLIAERVLKTYWEQAVKMQEQSEARDKSKKTFWYGVVKNFEGMLNEQELVKAKGIMTEREKFSLSTEKFINCLAADDYVSAGDFMSAMVESSLNGMIDVAKIQYQKELGEKVTKKLREV